MRFIHLADLHLGKMLHQYELIDCQKEALDQIVLYVKDHSIDAVVIAGDVYDRAIPPKEAVHLLDDFLGKLINDLHVKVLMIAGNHDSADRLEFASGILKDEGLYIEGHLKEEMFYVTLGDVRFYLLPFAKPADVHYLFADAPHHNYQEAMAYYMDKQAPLDHHYKNILVTHQFVGHHSQVSDSEMTLAVGGSEIIDPALFHAFDYVALGHLHAPQYVGEKKIRYAGSLLKYSFDEAHQKKGFNVIDTDDLSITFVPLSVSQDVVVLKGSFDELMDKGRKTPTNDLVAAELSDDHLIVNAIDRLREVYPHILRITYPSLMRTEKHDDRDIRQIQKMDDDELFASFYKDVTGHDVNKEDLDLIISLLDRKDDRS